MKCNICLGPAETPLALCSNAHPNEPTCAACWETWVDQQIRVPICAPIRCPVAACRALIPMANLEDQVSDELIYERSSRVDRASQLTCARCHKVTTLLPSYKRVEKRDRTDRQVHRWIPECKQFAADQCSAGALYSAWMREFPDDSPNSVITYIHDPERRLAMLLHVIHHVDPILPCATCGAKHCLRCHALEHSGNCQQFLDRTQHDIVECPACHVPIVRSEGCDTVQCPCGEKFAWFETWCRATDQLPDAADRIAQQLIDLPRPRSRDTYTTVPLAFRWTYNRHDQVMPALERAANRAFAHWFCDRKTLRAAMVTSPSLGWWIWAVQTRWYSWLDTLQVAPPHGTASPATPHGAAPPATATSGPTRRQQPAAGFYVSKLTPQSVVNQFLTLFGHLTIRETLRATRPMPNQWYLHAELDRWFGTCTVVPRFSEEQEDVFALFRHWLCEMPRGRYTIELPPETQGDAQGMIDIDSIPVESLPIDQFSVDVIPMDLQDSVNASAEVVHMMELDETASADAVMELDAGDVAMELDETVSEDVSRGSPPAEGVARGGPPAEGLQGGSPPAVRWSAFVRIWLTVAESLRERDALVLWELYGDATLATVANMLAGRWEPHRSVHDFERLYMHS